MEIFGFSFIRNGVQYDYPFEESLLSLGAICKQTVVAVGDSQDDTLSRVKNIPNLRVVQTKWDESLREGGKILSEQTNIALNELRKIKLKNQTNAWAIYLQGDEVLFEREFDHIRDSIQAANDSGCDAIRFRYLHFWLSPTRIAIGKRWYPHEIRAIRLDSKIESYGDAQSFRGYQKIYDSDAHIFHYGHVREDISYENKKRDFHRWWHPDHRIHEKLREGSQKDSHEKTLLYLGPHPTVMHKRLMQFKNRMDVAQKPKCVVIEDRNQFLGKDFLNRIQADEVLTVEKLGRKKPGEVQIRLDSFLRALPKSMKNKNAREFETEFKYILELSRNGIRVV